MGKLDGKVALISGGARGQGAAEAETFVREGARVVFGTARAVIDRLAELRDQLGVDGVIAELNPGGRIPPELETRSLEILAREVAPALR